MNKRGLAVLLTAVIGVTQGNIVWAKEEIVAKQEAKVLTYAEAIKKAKDHSIELRMNAREYDLNKEKVDFAFDSGIYESWVMTDSNLSYTHKQKSILEEQITMSVEQVFETIHSQELMRDVLVEQQRVQEKLVQKAEIGFQNGRQSTLDVDKVKMDLVKTQQDIEQNKKETQLEYTKLSTMVGMNVSGYALEVVPKEYVPFHTKLTLDQFASSNAKEHIAVWRAAEQVKIANLPIYTDDYMKLIDQLENRKKAKDQQELTEKQLEERIRKLYIDNEKIQSDYELLCSQITLQEKQLQASKIYFENGRLSELEYTQQLLNYEQNKLKAEQLLNAQIANVKLLKKPYLISTIG
ncbi:MAG: TolC family protein [Cellulosilyticaceae bacterium]